VATNFFFRNIDYIPEQSLLNDLAEEMIKIFGIDVYYLPRTTGGVDELLTEAPNSSFGVAVPIEMYINTYEGFTGQGDILTKFGLSMSDRLVLSVSRRRFSEDIGSVYNLIRPQEGDLVYFPLTKGMFEIKFVEHEATFYQTGALQHFELQLEKFNYNGEAFSTGYADIDSVQQNYSTGSDNFYILTEDGYNLTTEDDYDLELESYDLEDIDPSSQNYEFQIESDQFTDFTVEDPFSEEGIY